MKNNKGVLVKKSENWYNLYINSIGIGSTHKELQGYRLSVTNCNIITNGYDLDELADEYQNILIKDNWRESPSQKIAFTLGFQKALEILGDKKFSEDDLRSVGQSMIPDTDYINDATREGMKEDLELYIKSLKEPEWKVEIVTEKVNGVNMHVCESPNFDSEGCIILKLID